MKDKIIYTFTEGMSVKKIKRLSKLFNGYGELKNADEKLLASLDFLTKKDVEKLLRVIRQIDVDKEIDKVVSNNVRIAFYGDKDYPARLYDISNPPWALYYCGKLPSDQIPAVSIIGARACSEYGKAVAKQFALGLSRRGVQIISGMASGIDGVAQRSAIECGESFGVLGCGVDVCYPISNRDLYDKLKQKGGIISEYLLGTKPEAYHFPMRNRIISGLSDIIVVVEAKEKSGTAITVSMALEQGKEVFAVPGRVGDKLSLGCNKLIRDGAGMALDVDDILLELEQRRSCNLYESVGNADNASNADLVNGASKKELNFGTYREMNMEEVYLANKIGEGPIDIDELWRLVKGEGLIELGGISELMVKLMDMELNSIITSHNGRYELI